MWHQVGIGDQHAGRIRVRAKNTHRFARLHQQRFVIFKRLQRVHNGIKGGP